MILVKESLPTVVFEGLGITVTRGPANVAASFTLVPTMCVEVDAKP